MPGGYLGVDVFFVISGFLITSLLIPDMERGRLDLAGFWERRVRRILPALVLVTGATLVAGWFLLLPADFLELGRSVCAQALLGSNVFFWLNTEYFDGAAELKPLLHTWSLAVEEQFYLLFPAVIFGLGKLRRLTALGVLALLCLVSFALAVNGVAHHPRAAFYLLPFRAWELGLGALLVLARLGDAPRGWWKESLGGLGLAMIAAPLFLYTSATPFPGFAALPPCLGTALFIYANGGSRTTTGDCLAQPAFVAVGLISYSLYLWHWPVLVFARYWAPGELSLFLRIGLVLVALLLAAASWKMVEIPFRKRRRPAARPVVFGLAGFATVALVSAGAAISWLQGIPQRLPRAALDFAQARFDFDPHFNCQLTVREALEGRFLSLGDPAEAAPVVVLVWGDSHAMAVLPALDQLGKQHGARVLAATHSETPPLIDYFPDGASSLKNDAPSFSDAIVSFVRTHHVPNVLLVARWKGYHAGQSEPFHLALTSTVNALRATGTRIWIMKEVPNFPADIPRALAAGALLHLESEPLRLSADEYAAQLADQEREFHPLTGPNVVVLSPSAFLVRDGAAIVVADGAALYRDVHHLTIHGARLLCPLFAPLFADFNQTARPSASAP